MLGVEACLHLGWPQADPWHQDQLQRAARRVRGLRTLLQGALMTDSARKAFGIFVFLICFWLFVSGVMGEGK